MDSRRCLNIYLEIKEINKEICFFFRVSFRAEHVRLNTVARFITGAMPKNLCCTKRKPTSECSSVGCNFSKSNIETAHSK